MSYVNQCPSGCSRVPYFSNPAISVNGSPTGIEDQRDNHRTINNTALTVSQFRDGSVGTLTPTNTPSPTNTATPTNTVTNTPTPTQTQTPFPEYDLRISQSATPSPVVLYGEPLTYTLIVSNVPAALGGNACPNVRFGFPSGPDFLFNSAIGTNGYSPMVDSNGITFRGGCISSQGGVTRTATLKIVITPHDTSEPLTLTSLGTNVVVDPENNWAESDETNNTAQTINTPMLLESCRCLTGAVLYANAAVPPKFIPNATVASTFGSPFVLTTTPTTGVFDLSGFGAGNYTIGVTKTTEQNGISSNDAARIAQHVAGVSPLTTNVQKITADASSNGVISSNDAALIAQYVAGFTPLPPSNLTATWRFFVPNPTFPVGASLTTRSYPGPIFVEWGQDFIGVLMGDVTGNWVPSAARPVETSRPEPAATVKLPQMKTGVSRKITVPVTVNGVANKNVISYEFELRYDPSVLQPLVEPVSVAGTVSRGLSVVTNSNESGLLRVVVYGAMPIDEDGVLLNLRFKAVGGVGSISDLKFENLVFNEGEPDVSVSDGRLELF